MYALLAISFSTTSANTLQHPIWENQSKVQYLWRRESELITMLQTKPYILQKKKSVSEVTAIPLITLVKLEHRLCNFLSEIFSLLGGKSEHR